MRIGAWRAVALAGAMAVGATLPGGAATAAAPAGFTVTCNANPLDGVPVKADGTASMLGRGSCTVEGSLGAPWELVVIVRLQVRIDGSWRTQGVATSWVDSDAATKRIRWLQASTPCRSGANRTWRGRVVAQARVNEKTTSILESSTATSPSVSIRC